MSRVTASAFLLLALATAGCAPAADPLAAGRDLFLGNRVADAVPELERAARSRRNDPEARAWLAEAMRRLGRHERADSVARAALALDPCHSFAHEVLGSNFDPQFGGWDRVDADSSWRHLLAAVACDSGNGSAWTGVWLQALGRGDRPREARALRALSRIGFFTPSALAYGRWLLRDLPAGALLIVNGDMDTYPLHVLQAAESLRADVAIANLSLLNLDWYRRLLRDRHGVRVPFGPAEMDALVAAPDGGGGLVTAADRMLHGWFAMTRAGTLGRPLAISTTVADPGLPPGHLVLRGAYSLVAREPATSVVDTASVRASLTSLRPADFAAPWTSDGDRSPVRRAFTPGLANNVLAAGLRHFWECRATGRPEEAARIQAWAVGFATEAGLDSVTRDRVARMDEAPAPPAPH